MIIGKEVIKSLEELYAHLQKIGRSLLHSNQQIRLDNASGLETFHPIRSAYVEKDNYSQYIDYKDQFVDSKNPSADWRELLITFLKSSGVLSNSLDVSVSNIITGFGTGYLFDKSVKVIIKYPGDVIIVPVPTYGFCMPAIEAAKGTAVFLPLKEVNNYQLDAQELEKKIVETNATLFKENIEEYIIKFNFFLSKVPEKYLQLSKLKFDSADDIVIYDSSVAFIRYLKKLVKTKIADHPELTPILKKIPVMPRVRGIYFINPNNPTGSIYSQDSVDILNEVLKRNNLIILEDLVHMEVRPTPPAGVGHVNQGFFGRTKNQNKQISLISPSKALGAAECRVGFAYLTKPKWANRIQEYIFNDGLFLSTAQQQALKNAFTITPERNNYIDHNNKEFHFRRELMRYLVLGTDAKIDECTQRKIEVFFVKHQLDMNILKTGLPGVSILNPNQEGGFFFVLDFSKLTSKYFLEFQLKTANDFSFLLKLVSVVTISGADMYFTDKPVLRVSFSLDPLLFIEGIKRVSTILSELSETPRTIGSLDTLLNSLASNVSSSPQL